MVLFLSAVASRTPKSREPLGLVLDLGVPDNPSTHPQKAERP